MKSCSWTVGYLSAATLSPPGAEPDTLIAAAAERPGKGVGGRWGKRVATALSARHRELETGMFALLDERESKAWAVGFRRSVGRHWPRQQTCVSGLPVMGGTQGKGGPWPPFSMKLGDAACADVSILWGLTPRPPRRT